MYEAGDVEGAIAQWQRALDVANAEETEPQLAIAVARYRQDSRSLSNNNIAIAALERDPRYADLDFLEENLWGEQLIADTRTFFSTPTLKDLLSQL